MSAAQSSSTETSSTETSSTESSTGTSPSTATATRQFSRQWRWLSWAVAMIVVLSALLIGVLDEPAPQSQAEQVQSIARTIRCPQCQGQSVAESDVVVARQIRADIARRVGEGQSTAEIQQAYIDQYDDPSIVLTPPADGLSAALWVVPLLGAALASLALVFALIRWQREAVPDVVVTSQDRDLVERAAASSSRDR